MSKIRIQWAAIGAAIAVTLGATGGVGLVQATRSSGERSVFVPVVPCRIADTRPAQGIGGRTSPVGPAEALVVDSRPTEGPCAGVVPADATGLGVNITAVQATTKTFLTLYPGGAARPETSTLNPVPGDAATVNGATTGISPSGQFNVYNEAGSVHAVIDINGYYVDHDHDDRYLTEVITTPGINVDLFGFEDFRNIDTVSETFTTTQRGYLDISKHFVGRVSCSPGDLPRAHYLIVDGVPLKSSLVYSVDDAELNRTLIGVTATPIDAGEHTVSIAGECAVEGADVGFAATELSISAIRVIPAP